MAPDANGFRGAGGTCDAVGGFSGRGGKPAVASAVAFGKDLECAAQSRGVTSRGRASVASSSSRKRQFPGQSRWCSSLASPPAVPPDIMIVVAHRDSALTGRAAGGRRWRRPTTRLPRRASARAVVESVSPVKAAPGAARYSYVRRRGMARNGRRSRRSKASFRPSAFSTASAGPSPVRQRACRTPSA